MADLSSPQPDMTDDRPLAVRRKRRCSTGLVDSSHTEAGQPTVNLEQALPQPARTPSKPKKRVRFSDPGPETSSASSSTGLTPYLRRTSFTHRARQLSHRLPVDGPRRSLPNSLLSSPPSLSLSPSSDPISGEVQFETLSQKLEKRATRRLRRRNLSEELNNIDAERKSRTQLKQEIQDLKRTLADARQVGTEEGKNDPTTVRVQEIEKELSVLKEEKRERSITADPVTAADVFWEPSTPSSAIFVDDTSDDFVDINFDDQGALRDLTPIVPHAAVNKSATQASLPHPAEKEILRSARLSLEYLFPGEIALGLIPENPEPLFDKMLERLQSLKTQTLVTEDALSTTQTQEANLRAQFNAVLEQLDRARAHAEKVGVRHATEAAATQVRVHSLEKDFQDASSKAEDLQKDSSEKDRSIQKLQDALETYRIEVGKLETLITRIEDDHSAAMAKIREEMDEAVADLECHVAAETSGRRAAEQEVVEQEQKIKKLKIREQELLHAVNEKQQIIRDTENIFVEERAGREREVGGLNVQIGELSTGLYESKRQRTKAEQTCDILLKKLAEEKAAAQRAVAAVQDELARCSHNTESIKAAHASDSRRRGAEVTEHKGLLTPVSACRFKDVKVEGYVDMRRGKGRRRLRPDSGIGVLEEDEDEDEDEIMTDDM